MIGLMLDIGRLGLGIDQIVGGLDFLLIDGQFQVLDLGMLERPPAQTGGKGHDDNKQGIRIHGGPSFLVVRASWVTRPAT